MTSYVRGRVSEQGAVRRRSTQPNKNLLPQKETRGPQTVHRGPRVNQERRCGACVVKAVADGETDKGRDGEYFSARARKLAPRGMVLVEWEPDHERGEKEATLMWLLLHPPSAGAQPGAWWEVETGIATRTAHGGTIPPSSPSARSSGKRQSRLRSAEHAACVETNVHW